MGWVHRQGLIRHREPAVGAEGLGRLEGHYGKFVGDVVKNGAPLICGGYMCLLITGSKKTHPQVSLSTPYRVNSESIRTQS